MKILVTGGAGYIGTHTIIELVAHDHEIVIVDALYNSSEEALRRVEKITGKTFPFYKLDVSDKAALRPVFEEHSFDAAIHFAGHKAVGESVRTPLKYYRNNIDSTLTLCELMQEFNVHKLVFSSSATVYGIPQELPLKETSPVGSNIPNPYGQTKAMIEQILKDLAASDSTWQISLLRYFNPIGAHESGLIGEDPAETPNNIAPYISQVAVGKLEKLSIFGDDYNTPDGTAIRDYIHVVDLARGHVAALEHLPATGAEAYNLGTGHGVSVRELLNAFNKACGKELPYEVVGRRAGDVESCYADTSKAAEKLGWKATRTTEDACQDAWRWQSQNPDGYKAA